jgi:hypothetical protein
MSMSEFERRQGEIEDGLTRSSKHDAHVPDDFSADDLDFARELHDLFSLEEEDVPPYYVQTLLDAENPQFLPPRADLEVRTRVRVFRRLNIRRRLFHPQERVWHPAPSLPPLRRSFLALATACVLFMIVTMLATSNSFAAGLVYLFSGAHSGVIQYKEYPKALNAVPQQAHSPAHPRRPKLTLVAAQQMLHFPIYWPSVPDNFVLGGMYLYHGTEESWQWIDGPIMKFVYTFSKPGASARGTGQIVVWEFMPKGAVLQGVQMGAAHQVQITDGGQAALFVNGQWVKINQTSRKWVYDGSGELIYEHNGVIFWIQGDQGDGIDQRALVDIATSLKTFDVQRYLHMSTGVNDLTGDNDSPWFSVGIRDSNSPGGPSLIVAGPEDQQWPLQKGPMRLP